MFKQDTSSFLGEYSGLAGRERALYNHLRDPDVLVGIEHYVRDETFLRLYYLTGNIFYYLFPKNFVKIIAAGNTPEDPIKSISMVRRLKVQQLGYGVEYNRKKQDIIDTISPLFLKEILPYLILMIDFNGSSPNLLKDDVGNPIYVDKLSPSLLEYLDWDAISRHINDSRKFELMRQLIEKTIVMYRTWKEKRDKIDALIDGK